MTRTDAAAVHTGLAARGLVEFHSGVDEAHFQNPRSLLRSNLRGDPCTCIQAHLMVQVGELRGTR